MAEQTWALVDADGVVINTIIADQAFITELPAQIADPDVDTGDLSFSKAFDVTGKDVGIGYTRSVNGKWVAPVPPVLTPEEQAAADAAAAAAKQRADDEAFLVTMDAKTRAGTPLTQDERDRMMAISLSRGQ